MLREGGASSNLKGTSGKRRFEITGSSAFADDDSKISRDLMRPDYLIKTKTLTTRFFSSAVTGSVTYCSISTFFDSSRLSSR